MNNNFLQSKEWQKFQEAVGRKTFLLASENFHASIIEHNLPIIGKYFYIPRGPILKKKEERRMKKDVEEIINLAKKEKTGWIRIEPEKEKTLSLIKENLKNKIIKASHDMQPKETLIIDISKSEEEILTGMKSKTRYNIKLAQKHNVLVRKIPNSKFQIPNKIQNSNDKNSKYDINDFLRLNKIMAKRQGIETHDDEYYKKMFEIIPGNILKLYLAEYQEKIIAANIMIFFGDTATYLHGASDDEYRNVMAPYFLQWQAIKDAKLAGCKKYDFFGVKVKNKTGKSWEGVTRFKLGFSPNTETIEYPGCYDIVISPSKYAIYKFLQKVKSFL